MVWLPVSSPYEAIVGGQGDRDRLLCEVRHVVIQCDHLKSAAISLDLFHEEPVGVIAPFEVEALVAHIVREPVEDQQTPVCQAPVRHLR